MQTTLIIHFIIIHTYMLDKIKLISIKSVDKNVRYTTSILQDSYTSLICSIVCKKGSDKIKAS
ncbi:hypothetical protein T07_5313 [Trichinella nelsoni]|uniref:Uncharacterized protein n=1 Tax=Trichinella nelsoni TaxID=6336 RepID=A0A0V0RIC7_9BILA|nr:hypothetical protein T07_5313 [Trichinella nelsoni]